MQFFLVLDETSFTFSWSFVSYLTCKNVNVHLTLYNSVAWINFALIFKLFYPQSGGKALFARVNTQFRCLTVKQISFIMLAQILDEELLFFFQPSVQFVIATMSCQWLPWPWALALCPLQILTAALWQGHSSTCREDDKKYNTANRLAASGRDVYLSYKSIGRVIS